MGVLLTHLPTITEHSAVAVAAVSGVLAGKGKRVDLFGVLVLALVTAFGGGTLRDLLLGDVPVIWMREPHLLITACAAAFATFIAARFFRPPVLTLLVADAFALALFTMIGTKKALAWGAAPSIGVTLGVMTGVAGGIFRDVLTGEIPLVFRPQIYLYATAALLGAVVFVLLASSGLPPQAVLLTGAAVTLSLRLAAIRWKIILPEFRGHDASNAP